MKFKTEELREQYWKLTPKARYLASYIDYLLWKMYKKEATITCVWYEGGSGVHSQWRAFDIRTQDYLSGEQIEEIKERVNKTFPYDINRPKLQSCIYHKVDSKKISEYKLKDFVPQYHLHCQCWIK